MDSLPNIQVPNLSAVLSSLNASIQSLSSTIESTQMINSLVERFSVLQSYDWQKNFWWNELYGNSMYSSDWLGGRDSVEDNMKEKTQDFTSKIELEILDESTDTASLNAINERFLIQLRNRTDSFLNALAKTDFENGLSNDVTEEVQSYYSINKSVTINWLYEIYSKNQKNSIIIEGLLQIIAMTIPASDSNSLLPIVKCGLTDISPEAQEASIAVIESWRTKECLDALQTTLFRSKWMESYAKKVEKELEAELRLCVSI